MKGFLASMIVFLLLVNSVGAVCPPPKYSSGSKRIGAVTYTYVNANINTPDCNESNHWCGNTAQNVVQYRQLMAVTKYPADVEIKTLIKESVSITKDDVVRIINQRTYGDLAFTVKSSLPINVEDVPSLADANSSQKMEEKIHQTVENSVTRLTREGTNVILEHISTALDKITVGQNTKYISYEKIFYDFYENDYIKTSTITTITDVEAIRKDVNYFEFTEPGNYFIYTPNGVDIVLVVSPKLMITSELTPKQKLEFKPKEKFPLTWNLKNTGVGDVNVAKITPICPKTWSCDIGGFTEGKILPEENKKVVMNAECPSMTGEVVLGINVEYDDGYGLTPITPKSEIGTVTLTVIC